MELRVGNKYRLGRKIGSGSFGDIYLGMIQLCLVYLFSKWSIYSDSDKDLLQIINRIHKMFTLPHITKV